MDLTIILPVISGALQAIQAMLPGLAALTGSGSGATLSIVSGIIAALTKIIPVIEQLAPLVGNEIVLIYRGVKNIIANLKGDSIETSAEQDKQLDDLDAQVDAAWDKVAPQFDPDYVPPGAAA